MLTANNIKAKSPTISEVLVLGIGNCGRSDDGLGWAFLDQLEAGGASASLAYRYQLQIEDAEKIAHYPFIVFVDATREVVPDGFQWRECRSTESFAFSTHALAPEAITQLCEQLYDAKPLSYILAIQGYNWGLGEGLSQSAQRNLTKALQYFYDQFNQ